MNKRWKIFTILFGAAALLLFLLQAGMARRFCAEPPRIELFSSNQDLVAAQAEAAGCAYDAFDGKRVDVYSSRLFLAQELAARIPDQELIVNDRSQAAVLARQAVELVVFAAQAWLLVLCLAILGRSIRKGREFWNAQLKRRYPKEILEEYAVEALVLAIKAVALLFLIALMVLGIIDFSFYLPQSILPQTYILNFSQWFSHPALSLPEISPYEEKCRTLLPALYQVGGACILCGSIALGLGIHCIKKGTRNKNQE